MPDTMTRIPVALACDSNHFLPVTAAVTSLLENAAPSTFYDVYILIQSALQEELTEKLGEFTAQYPNSTIQTIVIGTDTLKEAVIKSAHLTVVTLYRIFLPELLPDVEKCLYLDTDTIVEKDLSSLYTWPIGDNYFAGVRAAANFGTTQRTKERMAKIGIPSMNHYVNNGVMLMNLAKMREDGIEQRMLDLVPKGFECPCQDIMNKVCYGKVMTIPLHYNVMQKYMKPTEQAFFAQRGCRVCYSQEEYHQAKASPTVIHYVNRSDLELVKPWDTPSLPLANRWWHYARLSPFWPEIVEKYGNH
ncbi:glucosyltransferase [Clostridia bacterium]|nr:glucosyltransferase [Clostridia bacterium]